MIHIGNSWDNLLKNEFTKEYYQKLNNFIDEEYINKNIYPQKDQLFSIFRVLQVEDIKIVIIGQDPYHQPGQAHGMAFSVMPGVKKPPSLVNIFKEIKEDIGCEIPDTGYLGGWAKQGVFLINTCLSVEESKPNSHKGKGWEIFTDEVIRLIDADDRPKVFFLWGNDARKKRTLILNEKHLVLETVHPSPLSAYNGFFGCKHFSKSNAYLKENMREEIDWCKI
ncbi:MAG: uracil-DNA glycosylase [Fusobacteria bacterium]|nr:MAG: uracil-DNA glycosylase [Fusobacteriota bacterium]KAF0229317.1 MAG: uracil-DNA [Fusobacteriota bacterium]